MHLVLVIIAFYSVACLGQTSDKDNNFAAPIPQKCADRKFFHSTDFRLLINNVNLSISCASYRRLAPKTIKNKQTLKYSLVFVG